MCWRGWTVAWKLSTKDALSLHRRHRHVQACCAASLGEPSTRLPLNSPTTVWVEDGWTGWRRWTPPTVPNDLLPSLIAMGLKVFAKLRVSDAGSPRHYRRPDGKRCRRRSARDLSIRGIARELGIHRDTVRKYMNAESPPMARARATSEVS